MATPSTACPAKTIANPVTSKMILAGTGLVLVGFLWFTFRIQDQYSLQQHIETLNQVYTN